MSESLEPSNLTSQSLTESLGLADEALSHPIFQGISADGLVLSDALSVALVYALAMSDNLGLAETGQVRVDAETELEDGLTMGATASTHITALRHTIEALGLRDMAGPVLKALTSCTEALDLKGQAHGQATWKEILESDALGLSDSASQATIFIATMLEGLGLHANATSKASFTAYAKDDLSFQEAITKTAKFLNICSEHLGLGDVFMHIAPKGEVTFSITCKKGDFTITILKNPFGNE